MERFIDFGYSFSEPHVLTLSRPSASEKTVVFMQKEGVGAKWTYSSLKNDFPLTWTKHPFDAEVFLCISVDNEKAIFNKWGREQTGIPHLLASGIKEGVVFYLSAIATKKGVVFKISAKNNSSNDRQVHVQLAHTNGWVISNKGWIDGINNNLLLTMNQGRADKIIAYSSGADQYPMYDCTKVDGDAVPMADERYGVAENSKKKIVAFLSLGVGEQKSVYYFLPYNLYFEDLSYIEKLDFDKLIKNAILEWKRCLSRATRFNIADKNLVHCYNACLSDMFVMREKIGKNTGITCGTNIYRSSNSSEPLEAEMILETLGYEKEALKDYPMYLSAQEKDGCWLTRKGWEHEIWGFVYNKTASILHHYQLSRDKSYLEKYYPQMLSSAKFNNSARESTKKSSIKDERGLMPRGMGDCGMMNGADYYGVFYPNCAMSLASDYHTLEVAKILGKAKDVAFLEKVCKQAKTTLIKSMRANVIKEKGYVRTSSTAKALPSSMYGCLYTYFPCGFVDEKEPMIKGTVEHIENKNKSEGGLPVGTGWMKDGIWVAMALHNIARAYLRMGRFEMARQYLYPALNHASPFVTWCEERGVEKNTSKTSGDRQHLWTPLAILQYLVDAIFFEDKNSVNIFYGICPEWLQTSAVDIKNLRTPWGKTDVSLRYIEQQCEFVIKTERPIEKKIKVHYFDKEGKDLVKEIEIATTYHKQIL